MDRNHNNKNKDPKIPEEQRSHPRHEPYKREHKQDWLNMLLDDDDLIEEENAPV